ncbi:MAG: hypothetical protein AB7P49_02965 [Bdellovibrionales bacterium]
MRMVQMFTSARRLAQTLRFGIFQRSGGPLTAPSVERQRDAGDSRLERNYV